MNQIFARRPIVVALAGPNGAGKSSFYRTYLQNSGLRFVSADVLAQGLGIDPYKAAEAADHLRRQLVALRESFIFETVFSDPVGDKLNFLRQTEQAGYTALLLFVGISTPQLSDKRVAMRVSKGGHDVPQDKLNERFPRILTNLQRALVSLANIRVYDNSDLGRPYRVTAKIEEGRDIELHPPIPDWFEPLLPSR
ncbi:MAG: zeta toxin family protein [Terracidiphilus sp.]